MLPCDGIQNFQFHSRGQNFKYFQTVSKKLDTIMERSDWWRAMSNFLDIV